MNAADAIQASAVRHGWKMIYRDTTDTSSGRASLILSYQKGDLVLRLYYRLFGTPVNYMLKFYGKDPHGGINWGVEHAQVDRVSLQEDPAIAKVFIGAKKKAQILRWLKDN